MNQATKIIQTRPNPGGGYTTEVWEVDQKRINPAGDWDTVTDIKLSEFFRSHVEITWEDFGEEWIVEHIIFIQFKHEQYREIRNAKDAARKAKDTSGQ